MFKKYDESRIFFVIIDGVSGVEIMLHVSDIKKFERCPKLFHLSRTNRLSNTFFSFFHPFENMNGLIVEKLGIISPFYGERNDDSQRAQKASEEYTWLINPRFEYNSLRIRVPYMHKTEMGWELYFVVLQSAPTSDRAREFAFNVKVLRELGFKVANVFIVHLNKEYIRGEILNVDGLFTVVDRFYNSKGNLSTLIMDAISTIAIELDSTINDIATSEFIEDGDIKKTKCTRGTKCDYFDYCFPEYLYADDKSILHLVSSQNKYEMFNDGFSSLSDVDLTQVEGTRLQYAQIMAARSVEGFFMDELALTSWFNSVDNGIVSFLDFEWDIYCIPPYQGMSPLQVLPFQYSLHVSNETSITHYEYLGFEDCREEFIRNLVNDLPSEGPIFAYNAAGAEMLRLKELADCFPNYAKELLEITERMRDFSTPFEFGLIYDLRMRGLFSLKALSSMIHPDNDYHNLAVTNGLGAVKLHRKLEKETEKDQVLLKQLLDYCSKDTEELFAVYLWMKDKIIAASKK